MYNDDKEIIMINVWDYQEANRVRLVDIDNDEFTGNVIDVTDAEEFMDGTTEDTLTIEVDGKHIEFLQSEIKAIEQLQ